MQKGDLQLSIIIPTTGNREVLLPTLNHLRKAIIDMDVEVIVVDDSKDTFVHPDFIKPFKLLSTGGKGASYARNKGWREARADLLLFLDDDIWISRENLERTIFLHREPSNRAYNFYWTYPDELMEKLNDLKFGQYILKHKLYSNEHRVGKLSEDFTKMDGLTSQYFSIEKRWLEKTGGYDSIPFAGIEDMLLFQKLNEVGVEVYLSKNDRVYQYEVNRLDIESLCRRYYTGAITRRIAVEKGFDNLGMSFGKLDRLRGLIGMNLESALYRLEKNLPYGPLYEKVVNYLLFISSYKGFMSL